MKKYYRYALVPFYEISTNQARFWIWRFRIIISTLTLYLLWDSVLGKNQSIGMYTQSIMLTYIFAGSFISNLTIGTRAFALGDMIHQGDFANYLVKPINYFLAILMDDIGEKAINSFFSILELFILYMLLRPHIYIQTDSLLLSLSFLAILIGMVIYFLMGLLFSAIAFWASDTWGPRFLFSALTVFAAGVIFPLDILPRILFYLLMLTPFPYLIFFPISIYLGTADRAETFFGFSIAILWVIGLYILAKFVWHKGIQLYGSEGR